MCRCHLPCLGLCSEVRVEKVKKDKIFQENFVSSKNVRNIVVEKCKNFSCALLRV